MNSPPRLNTTLPSWITPKSLAVTAGLIVVIGLLLWPKAGHSPSPAEEAGYRVAKRLPSLRRENAEALRALEASRAATDAQYRKTVTHIQRQAERILNFTGPGSSATVATVDSLQIPTLGPTFPGDTLIPLRVVREHVTVLLDTVMQDVANLHAAVMIERGRASLANQNLHATIAAQDTIIVGLRAELTRKVPPWYRRASKGVVAMGAGVACGAATYVALGPVGAVGGAVLCSAIAGVR